MFVVAIAQVTLVKKDAKGALIKALVTEYARREGKKATIIATTPGPGARVLFDKREGAKGETAAAK